MLSKVAPLLTKLDVVMSDKLLSAVPKQVVSDAKASQKILKYLNEEAKQFMGKPTISADTQERFEGIDEHLQHGFKVWQAANDFLSTSKRHL